VALCGGTFRKGSHHHYHEGAPWHRVTVDCFWMKGSEGYEGKKSFRIIPLQMKDRTVDNTGAIVVDISHLSEAPREVEVWRLKR
jgi:hypothetical protein